MFFVVQTGMKVEAPVYRGRPHHSTARPWLLAASKPGETVVTDGQLRLMPNSKVTIKTRIERRFRSHFMNFAEAFIRRPVMTTLSSLAIRPVRAVMAYRLFAGERSAPTSIFPTIVRPNANLPGRQSRDDGVVSLPPRSKKQFLDYRGSRFDDLGEPAGFYQRHGCSFSLTRNIDAAPRRTCRPPSASHPSRNCRKGIAESAPHTRRSIRQISRFSICRSLSRTMPMSQVDEYAETYLAERISMISGVAQVQGLRFRKSTPCGSNSIRKALATPRNRHHRRRFSQAIQDANVDLPTGYSLRLPFRRSPYRRKGQLTNAAAYRPLIVALPERLARSRRGTRPRHR